MPSLTLAFHEALRGLAEEKDLYPTRAKIGLVEDMSEAAGQESYIADLYVPATSKTQATAWRVVVIGGEWDCVDEIDAEEF